MMDDIYFDGVRYVDIESAVEITGMSAEDLKNLARYDIIAHKRIGTKIVFPFPELQKTFRARQSKTS